MFGRFQKKLSKDAVEDIRESISAAHKDNDHDAIWNHLQPILRAQKHQRFVALALIYIIDDGFLTTEKSLDILKQVYEAHPNDNKVIGEIGHALESARDIDDLNAPPPESPLFKIVIDKLRHLSEKERGNEKEAFYVEALASTTRLCSRQYDTLAEDSYARLVKLLPEVPRVHYNHGLYFKTRGMFRRGILANQRAIELAGTVNEAYQWNLGICATGAGEGETALNVWKEQGQKIEMGRFNLPEGKYPNCKVKLSRYPLAERGLENDYPDIEETIWIERLSPCHGIIRSVLYEDLGVDYGDVILFDGAPITFHLYGDHKIAVFPHLSTLIKRNYQFFDFCGTQSENGALSRISGLLDDDAVIYSHTESFKIMCSGCWNNEDLQHEHDQKEENNIVCGRIAAPPDTNPVKLLNQIDAALQDEPENKIFSPDLCNAAGLTERARFEKRRFEMLFSY